MSFLHDIVINEFGKIMLTSAFGKNTEATLTRLPFILKIDDKNIGMQEPIEFFSAIAEKLDISCLLQPSVWEIFEATGPDLRAEESEDEKWISLARSEIGE